MPFATRIASGGGAASYRGLHSETSHNFIFANYGGSQGFDTDDGSAFHAVLNNAFYMADLFKNDYGAHDSLVAGNVCAVRPYDGQSCFNLDDAVPGFATQVYDNVCVLPPEGSRGDPELVDSSLGDDACTGAGPSSPTMHDNSYFTASGIATVQCSNGSRVDILSLPAPMEARAEVGKIPDDDTLISWFRAKLIALQ